MMSAPARRFGFFERTPVGWVVLWVICAVMGGTVLVALLMSGLAMGQLDAGWHTGLSLLATALLLPLPFATLAQLRVQHRVWLGRVAPLALWHKALRDHQRDLLLFWAVIALPLLVLRLLMPPAGEHWAMTVLSALWGAAMLAGLLGLALLLAAALQGLLSWPWGLGAGSALLALSYWHMATTPEALVLAWALQGLSPAVALAGGVTSLLMMMGMAAMASRLIHGRLAREARELGNLPGPVLRFKQSLGGIWMRWSEPWRRVDNPAELGSIPIAMLPQIASNLSNPDSERHFLQTWGSTVTPGHGLRLLALTLLATCLLRGAVSHWRVLLAPGGHFRRHLGPRIVGSTLASLVGFIVALSLALALLFTLLPFLPSPPWRQFPTLAWRYGLPLLADLSLAVALATCLRGMLGSAKKVITGLLGAGLLFTAVLLAPMLLGGESLWNTVLWTRGPAHHVAELALAAVFTLLARRAWARADLSELARKRTGQTPALT
ncbi:MAG: hypothetical protein ACK4S6_12135 [Roseateles asaccharophilus]|uniref:Uncharacterized protein n=2 Tax=Roseateles asaccharophilus TaxID=582607 RepID=A0A4R6NE99_9BURK|nr:hypothetical protein [Roseateles asaccharophilus]MDN3545080.1 hypothetical protein [Roseateles asaccharophilus]TDP12534.1 hypothetical protein DFR39_1016 [Roseateles asaccharophilus]